jgi:hypothetical protein
MQKLPNMPQKVGKPKSYPLVGEVDMADELNKIERSRPKGYRDAPVNKATKGRDMPLPSSDGLFSKLKSFIK